MDENKNRGLICVKKLIRLAYSGSKDRFHHERIYDIGARSALLDISVTEYQNISIRGSKYVKNK